MMGDLHVFGHSCCDNNFRLREENARLRQRVEELERWQSELLDEEVCPKCGYGISASCYGCKLKAAEAEVTEWRDTARSEMAGRAAAEAEVERLRAEFRRVEECVASILAGERCYAQVMKLLHEAPRAPEVKP